MEIGTLYSYLYANKGTVLMKTRAMNAVSIPINLVFLFTLSGEKYMFKAPDLS